jgi:hypothetical protein
MMNKLLKSYQSNTISGYLTLRFLAFLFLTIIITANLIAQSKDNKKKKTKRKPEYDIDLEMRSFYDDNILKNSEKYLERFMNREDEGRFHINTYDDLVLRTSASFTARLRLYKNLPARVAVGYTRNIYTGNNINTWDIFSFEFQQFYSRKGRINFSYSYIPDFYIRHYRDDDYVSYVGYVPEAFKPMSFSKANFSLYGQHTYFKDTGIRLALDYSKYYYNQYYIEYDSDDLGVSLRVFQPFLKNRLQTNFGFFYTRSFARGYDEASETLAISDEGDASFYDNRIYASAKWSLPAFRKLKDHDITLNGSLAHRKFSSLKYVEIDPLHAGRVDQNIRFSIIYGFKVSKSVDANIFYNFLKRNAGSRSTINDEFISLEKDYNQNQIGFSVKYNYKLQQKKKTTKKK